MRIAILGAGGREHALAWKLAQTLPSADIFALPGNGGIANSYAIDINDFAAVKTFCEAHKITAILVGPEVPLVNGIVDYFEASAIQVFGPTKQAAQLEGSKIFAKHFMQKYGVATAPFQVCHSTKEALPIIQQKKGNLVLKYDGLAGGKGVWVCNSILEATTALQQLEEQFGENCSFLIEEKIIGDEISIIGFTDGICIKLLLPAQDHKALLDGDKGLNTGGMGAICPVPFWNENLANKIRKTILNPTLKGIQAEQMDYKGMLYFGIIVGQEGVYLLEYNVRLGDPEAEILLPALNNDLVEIMEACWQGNLSEIEMDLSPDSFAVVVQVSEGYPKEYQKGYEILGLDKVKDALIFHGGTQKKEEKYYTNGGRVLHTMGQGTTLGVAIQKAYTACEKINFKDNYYRKDIGQRKSNIQ